MLKKIAVLLVLVALSMPGFVAADTLDDIQKRGVLRGRYGAWLHAV